MAGTKITPEKIRSPIQLVAAWFALIAVLTPMLLTAAHNIERPWWAAGFLIAFSAFLILCVLASVLMMLTKFRPHLQEGPEYAQWLRDEHRYSGGFMSAESLSAILSSKDSSGRGIEEGQEVEPEVTDRRFYPVEVIPLPGYKQLVSALSSSGYQVNIFREDDLGNDDFPLHQAIWVGHRVPVPIAVQAIKIASSHWPHLCYLELSNDGAAPPDEINDQLFLGGSTRTAVTSGLTSWSTQELQALQTTMPIEDFHALIRQKYTRRRANF